jgi:hypothetical protein
MPRARRNSRFADYNSSVFVNCPFDRTYKPVFDSIVFAIIHCGFRARCALEIDDASQVRIEKIFSIVEECRFGIHDLSRTQLDAVSRLPRFNMPLELGMFLGVKRSGDARQPAKMCLILDRQPYRYQKFISDIAGQDIRAHASRQRDAVSLTRDWLRSCSGRAMPGGIEIYRQYLQFRRDLPQLCTRLRLEISEATFNDFISIIAEWLKAELASQASDKEM